MVSVYERIKQLLKCYVMRLGILTRPKEFAKDFVQTRGLAVHEIPNSFEINGESTDEAIKLFGAEASTRFQVKDYPTAKDGIPASLSAAQIIAAGCPQLNSSPSGNGAPRIEVRVTPQLMTTLGAILSRKLGQDRSQIGGLNDIRPEA